MSQDLIDPKYVDVEHEDHGFSAGFAGDGPDFPAFGAEWPANVPILEPHEWYEYTEEQKRIFNTDKPERLFISAHNDQSPESSCVHNMLDRMFTNRRNRSLGPAWEIKGAPMWSYQFNCSSRHSGSYTMDALKWGIEYGLIPEHSSAMTTPTERLTRIHERVKALAPHSYHQNTPYRGKRDYEEGKQTSRWLRLALPIHIRTKNQWATACAYGWGVGCGRSGHSIAEFGLTMHRSGDRNNPRNWCTPYLDSYDVHRGDDGWLYDSYDKWQTSGAWTIGELWYPDNPCVFPFGKDTKHVSLEKCYELFPDADRDYVQQLYDQGPGDAEPPQTGGSGG